MLESNRELNLSCTVEEVNLILSALGNLPFIQVHELIAKLQTQATAQLLPAKDNKGGTPVNGGARTAAANGAPGPEAINGSMKPDPVNH